MGDKHIHCMTSNIGEGNLIGDAEHTTGHHTCIPQQVNSADIFGASHASIAYRMNSNTCCIPMSNVYSVAIQPQLFKSFLSKGRQQGHC